MDDYNSHTIIYRAVFIKATTATPPFRHLSPNCNISKGGICCGSQPQRRNLQRLTAANTSLFAYRSLGGNVLCCSSYTIANTSATAV
ncbi:Uncharacterised protein [[Eubacterium] siraeum]|uniref:Uncharacterized protein n=1 Tax=[Eubacterium] siraeum TaxID=39492 RepID=A0A174Z3F4_9FIRM|nr:Uncharacterised protein [[Eubacterium] siraeum]